MCAGSATGSFMSCHSYAPGQDDDLQASWSSDQISQLGYLGYRIAIAWLSHGYRTAIARLAIAMRCGRTA